MSYSNAPIECSCDDPTGLSICRLHTHTDLPVCPHGCGYVERDAWELDFGPGGEGDTVTACARCGADYRVSRHVSVSYSTGKVKP